MLNCFVLVEEDCCSNLIFKCVLFDINSLTQKVIDWITGPSVVMFLSLVHDGNSLTEGIKKGD